MKRKIVFVCIMITLAIIYAIHIAIAYVNIFHSSTSALATVAFLLILPYALAVATFALIWLIVTHKIKKDKK